MIDVSVITDQIKSVRRQTLAVLDALVKQGKAYVLPDPLTDLEAYCRKLLDNTYKVLVVGEMKRGKSSFVNALIGRDILPTDVDISTCEVFRVQRALKEDCRIRFEDGSAQEITAAQLKEYGSQGVRDIEGVPPLNQIIRWIEVDLPAAEFLPVGVSLLDTPGLGSLYAAHGQITQRFVPQADAVIFVLDAEKPIIQSELEFVGKILDVTRNIFFVLTKIDLYDDDHWQEIQKRDEERLMERFKDRLDEARIWPFSSMNLRQAASTHNDISLKEDLLEVSYYQQLASALQTFLFKVAGWARSAEAVLVADHYHSMAEKTLLRRLTGLQEPSKQKLYKLQQQSAQRKNQFDADWGTNGKKSRELTASIQKVAMKYKRNFVSLLEVNGKFEVTYRQKIDASNSPEEAKKLGETMDELVVTEVLNTWRTTCEQAYHECIELLTPFVTATDALLPAPDTDAPDLVTHGKSIDDIKSDLLAKLKEANTGLQTGIKVSAGVVLTAGWLAGVFFPPAALPLYVIGIPAALVMGVWQARRGWKGVQEKQLQEAQQALHSHLTDLIREVRMRFLQADRPGDLSVVNHYFNALVDTMAQQLTEIAEAKSNEAQAENSRLDEEMRLDEQQREAKRLQIQRQLTEWDTVGQSIAAIMATLKDLDRSLQK